MNDPRSARNGSSEPDGADRACRVEFVNDCPREHEYPAIVHVAAKFYYKGGESSEVVEDVRVIPGEIRTLYSRASEDPGECVKRVDTVLQWLFADGRTGKRNARFDALQGKCLVRAKVTLKLKGREAEAQLLIDMESGAEPALRAPAA